MDQERPLLQRRDLDIPPKREVKEESPRVRLGGNCPETDEKRRVLLDSLFVFLSSVVEALTGAALTQTV